MLEQQGKTMQFANDKVEKPGPYKDENYEVNASSFKPTMDYIKKNKVSRSRQPSMGSMQM